MTNSIKIMVFWKFIPCSYAHKYTHFYRNPIPT